MHALHNAVFYSVINTNSRYHTVVWLYLDGYLQALRLHSSREDGGV